MIHILVGDIFKSGCQAIVNPVNTVGASGKGLALEFAKRFPEMDREYRRTCKAGDLPIGKVMVWDAGVGEKPRYIICLPTKDHWRQPSKMSFVKDGLSALARECKSRNITSVAVPALGAGLGGLPWSGSEGVRTVLLHWGEENPTVNLEIYEPRSKDDSNG